MALDSSIYSMIRPQAAAPDPMEQYGKVLSLQNMMAQQDLQGLQTQQARQGIADDLVVRNAYKQSGGDPKALRAALASGGQYKAVQAFDKNQLETETGQATLAKTKQEVLAKSLAINRDLLAGVNDPQQAAQWVMAGFNDPVLSPFLQRVGSPQELIAKIPQDPQGFQRWKMQNGLGIEEMLKITAPKMAAVDTGKTSVLRETNPLAPGFSAEPVLKTTTPGEDMTDQRTRQEGALNRGMTARGQNMADTRAREAALAGKIPPGYRATADGGLEAVPGGPADIKEEQKTDAVKKVVDMYVAARNGVMQGLEGSITGPVVGRVTPFTAKQQIAEGGVAAMAPVLKQLFRVAGEGVFTDRDQALLLDMVPKRTDEPVARNAKMANIDAIVSAKLGMAVPDRKVDAQSKSPVAVRIKGDDGYNALPKGALYVGPDGVTRRKP